MERAGDPQHRRHASDGRDDYTPSVAAIDANTYAAGVGSASPGADHQDVFSATSTDGGVTWSAPVPLNPVSAAAAGQNDLDFNPSLASGLRRAFLRPLDLQRP